jgi:hypothetical protein
VRSLWSIVLLAGVGLASCSRSHTADAPRARAAEAPPAARAAGEAAPDASFPDLASLPPLPPPPEDPPKCEDVKDVHVFPFPQFPWTGAPLRVIAFSEKPLAATLRIHEAALKGKRPEPTGEPVVTSDVRHGGPPYFWIAEVPSPRAGPYVASVAQKPCDEGKNVATLAATVGRFAPAPPPPLQEGDGLWPVRRTWNRTFEDLYAAWIETLFDAPDAEMPSWPALHEVLRDSKRNLLFDFLGASEDSANAPVVKPDCADLPYMLRAYFAWKLKLPWGIGECNRGGGGAPPSCKPVIVTNEDPPAKLEPTLVKQFATFLRSPIADKAHSGSARQPFEEENSDYYPVPLTWESLRPGTIYADPYGHVLVIAKRLPQSGERGGVLLAVDGQPDGTVARKRFWRGNFLYATERELGGPGWKRFRPVVRRDGHLARLGDAGIQRSPEYGDLSRDAQKLDVEGFYDKMDDVLSPRPLDPHRAMMEVLAALEEQVRTRVKSVDNGRRWLETAKASAPMPDGPEIFETNGVWEDFSTPSRDLRLLIAIDVARGFPARVARRPERYAMPPGRTPADVAAELERTLKKELETRSVQYTRTDGSPFTLTLAEVLARAPALEMAYNPNECVEARWGAPATGEEARPCNAHAPADQVTRMESYRAWFHDRRRPPRK